MVKDNKKSEVEKLNAEIERLKKELKKRKKYGLVWEEKPEEVVEMCKEKLPVLKEVKNKGIIIDKNKPVNLLIEGDNYHALSVLNYTHKGKIDVIYIDPPYNRGGDFLFNDKYIDKDDAYKHSKWLSFMIKRLSLTRDLLSSDGVMFVSIDDAEQAQLRLLLNAIFGESNIDVMIWRKSGYGREGKMKNVTTFRKDHEYIIVCYRRTTNLNKINELPDFQNEYGNPDNDPRGPYKAGSISRREDASNPSHSNFYTVVSPSGKKFTRQFDIPEEDFHELDNDYVATKDGKKVSRVYWGKNDDSVPAIKIYLNEQRDITPYSVLLTKGTTTEGTKEVSEILNKDCTKLRPKPASLIQTFIQLAVRKPNSIILDFFAGTGTTGHAVLKYNLKYKKNLQFILCTNDVEKICTDYCYPRIKNVILGYKKKDGGSKKGIVGNLKYFKTDFVDYGEPTDRNKIKLTKQATEMLCVKEGTFEKVLPARRSNSAGGGQNNFKIFKNANHYTGIIFDQMAIPAFKKAIKDIKGKFSVYVFSLGDETFNDEFKDIKQKVQLSPIPEAILRVYRRIFNG